MKELEKLDREIDRAEIETVQTKQQQQEYKYLDSLRPLKGHKLFEINIKTGKVKEAEYKVNKVITWWEALDIYNGKDDRHNDVIVNPDCVYVFALNADNALDRYKQNKGSAKMNKKESMNPF